MSRVPTANVPGVDFITAAQTEIGETLIYVNDAKSSLRGVFPVPVSGISISWSRQVQEAIAPGRLSLGDEALELEIRRAFAEGNVFPRQLNVDRSRQLTISGFE